MSASAERSLSAAWAAARSPSPSSISARMARAAAARRPAAALANAALAAVARMPSGEWLSCMCHIAVTPAMDLPAMPPPHTPASSPLMKMVFQGRPSAMPRTTCARSTAEYEPLVMECAGAVVRRSGGGVVVVPT